MATEDSLLISRRIKKALPQALDEAVEIYGVIRSDIRRKLNNKGSRNDYAAKQYVCCYLYSHFGNVPEIAEAMGVTRTQIYRWTSHRYSYKPPHLRQDLLLY